MPRSRKYESARNKNAAAQSSSRIAELNRLSRSELFLRINTVDFRKPQLYTMMKENHGRGLVTSRVV